MKVNHVYMFKPTGELVLVLQSLFLYMQVGKDKFIVEWNITDFMDMGEL